MDALFGFLFVVIIPSLVIAIFVVRHSLNKEIKQLAIKNADALEVMKVSHAAEVENVKAEAKASLSYYSAIIDKDEAIRERAAELEQLKEQLQAFNEKYTHALQVHGNLEKEISLYTEDIELMEYGVYKPQFDYETSEQYKYNLERNYEQQKQLVKNDKAVICRTEWSVGGSKTEGARMTKQYNKLMLYAFNGECDSLIAKVKWNNATRSAERIRKAFESVNKLGVTQQSFITEDFLQLKLDELALTHEYEQKKYEEKEEQRRIREQMREEEKAQREFEKAQKEAEDEEKSFEKSLARAQKELQNASEAEMEVLQQKVLLLEKKLQEAHEKKERAISMAQMTKVGHIYVISNVGSFGQDVYKIGMTRRLDPLDRIKELGDASVPFQFDVHAIIYSENAPQLENELHKRFNPRRLNRINAKKEFFKVSLDEIEAFITEQTNAEIQFTKLAEAKEYRETMALIDRMNSDTPHEDKLVKYPASFL